MNRSSCDAVAISSANEQHVDSAIEKLSWYHPNATRHIAESLLMQNGLDGSYLMRPSSSRPGDLAISIRCRDSVRHFNVNVTGEQYLFGLATFSSLQEFLDHFEKQPVVAGESGQMAWLRYPYPRDITEPSIYEHVRIHAQYGKDNFSHDELHLAVGSKEGFMTKLGGIVKNWKTRWFVLSRNQLRYFRRQSDTNPVRVLDLRDCIECEVDTSRHQPHCMRCETEQDMNEWIKLIQWKLRRLRGGNDDGVQ